MIGEQARSSLHYEHFVDPVVDHFFDVAQRAFALIYFVVGLEFFAESIGEAAEDFFLFGGVFSRFGEVKKCQSGARSSMNFRKLCSCGMLIGWRADTAMKIFSWEYCEMSWGMATTVLSV